MYTSLRYIQNQPKPVPVNLFVCGSLIFANPHQVRECFISVLIFCSTNDLVLPSVSIAGGHIIYLFYLFVFAWNSLFFFSLHMYCLRSLFFCDFLTTYISVGWWFWRRWQWWGHAWWTRSWKENREKYIGVKVKAYVLCRGLLCIHSCIYDILNP
jgi:hypothetical protein